MRIGHSKFCQLIPQIIGGDRHLYTTRDKQFVDLMCGTSCTGLGYLSKVQQEILFEALLVPLNTYDYPTIWREQAEEQLRRLYPQYEFAFFNGGAEAVEAAIKIARDSGYNKKIACFDGCFHGKTYLAGLLTDNVETDMTTVLEYNKVPVQIPDDVSIIVVEPVQCRNGVRVSSEDFMSALVTKANEKGVCVICDEVSTGIRCGYPLAINYFLPLYDPAIICLGKNIGQGIPVSLVGVHSDFAQSKVSLTSGFGGNALACIAVTETIKELQRGRWFERIKSRGRAFYKSAVSQLNGVESVRGLGMWLGITFASKELSQKVAEKLIERGFIVGSVPPHIRLAPSFDLPGDIWLQFIDTVNSVLGESK